MVRFWNLIYYFAYKGDYKLHLLFNKINPVLWFYSLNYSKRRFAKMGIDNPVERLNKSFKDLDGISSFRAGAFMILLIVLLCFGLSFIFIGLFKIRNFNSNIFILVAPITLIFNYLLIFQKNKYINYFEEFENMDKTEKKKWALISFITIIGILIFSIGSFIFMDYRV